MTALIPFVGFTANAQTKALLLYGGSDHKTFLGCLNCGQYDQGSVCNDYGKGSEYNSDSIWNAYGTYGNSYSSSSPWNEYSQSAPVIVDKDGNFYGYLSANEYHNKRTRIDVLNSLTKLGAKDLSAAKKAFCAG